MNLCGKYICTYLRVFMYIWVFSNTEKGSMTKSQRNAVGIF